MNIKNKPMAKISINLLPSEMKEKEIKQQNFNKIQFAGIGVILIMIFLASLSAALRILQSHSISLAQEQVTQLQQKVAGLKETQESLFLLKNRLSVIDKYLGVSSNQSFIYNLLERLIPDSVVINAMTIGKTGEVVLLAITPDSISLDTLITNLTTKDSNEDKISKVSIENLSRGRDGFYRTSFKITPK